MVLLQRLDQQEIEREPDGTAPVRVSAEQAGRRFRRRVVEREFLAVELQHERMHGVVLGHGAHAVRTQEPVLIQDLGQDAPQLRRIDDAQPDAILDAAMRQVGDARPAGRAGTS